MKKKLLSFVAVTMAVAILFTSMTLTNVLSVFAEDSLSQPSPTSEVSATPIYVAEADKLAGWGSMTGDLWHCYEIASSELKTEGGRTFARFTSSGTNPYVVFVENQTNQKIGRYMAISYRTNFKNPGQIFMGPGVCWSARGDVFGQTWNGDGNWNLAIIDIDKAGLSVLTDYAINYGRLDMSVGVPLTANDYFDIAYVAFFDSVEAAEKYDVVSVKQNDGVGPVIQYNGSTTIKTSAGKPFDTTDFIAYDEQDKQYVMPTWSWSDGAIDENGRLYEGTHTCQAIFTDSWGNTSTLTLTLDVDATDTEAPVIHFGLSTIYATAGTRVDLAETIVVTDNYDIVTPVLTWSEGAVDTYNRLLVGTHTLTITATDLTGVQSQKIVTFIVVDAVDTPATPTPIK